MDADIKGSLNQLNKSYSCFEHKGESLTKEQVRYILEHGLRKGYKYTDEFTDNEVDKLLELYSKWETLEKTNLDQKIIIWD